MYCLLDNTTINIYSCMRSPASVSMILVASATVVIFVGEYFCSVSIGIVFQNEFVNAKEYLCDRGGNVDKFAESVICCQLMGKTVLNTEVTIHGHQLQQTLEASHR